MGTSNKTYNRLGIDIGSTTAPYSISLPNRKRPAFAVPNCTQNFKIRQLHAQLPNFLHYFYFTG